MTWKASDPQGNESAKVRWEVVRYTRGRGLDIGCGPWKQFPHWIGVDNRKDTALFGMQMDPDVTIDSAENLNIFATESLDFVFSSHLLEHMEPEKVVKTLNEWFRVVKPNGYVVLYLPDAALYPKVGEEGANPDHKWNVDYDSLVKYAEKTHHWYDLVDYQLRDQGMEYSGLYVFQKLTEKRRKYSWKKPKPEKTAGVVRYGAIGDLLQASSVLAGLKKQGYHITLYSSPPQSDILKHDPHVDEFYLQGKDQVPNHYLGEFWDYHRKKYDKWVNLSETVEGSFLALPGRTHHAWPPPLRHRLMNVNYLEAQHAVAGVPHEPNVKFYPTSEEVAWAKKERSKMGEFLVLWQLSGSSVHKRWSGIDNIIAAIMLQFPQAHVVLTGGEADVILEAGWEKEPRVHLRSGKWTTRETLSFVSEADLVIGPETGVVNCAAQLPIPKVVLLSHSTHENLTRDWVNVHPIASEGTVCPGRGSNEAPACHQLHYGWDHCKQSIAEDGKPTGVSQCMQDITVDQVWKVLWHAITWALEAKAA